MSATLHGIVRDKLGSRFSRALRRQGRVPASIQGESKDHVHISLDKVELLTARRHHEHLFDIEMDHGETETALIRELQWGTFGEQILHVEFRRVVRGQKTEVEVELLFTGHPKGGAVNHLMAHITVLALPSQIPDSIEVRVDGLEEGATIHARDLELPESAELVTDGDTLVASVSAVRAFVEESAEGEDEEVAAEGVEAPAAPAEGEEGS